MAESGSSARRAVPVQMIVLGMAALALAFFVGTQVIGVLYGIVAPPMPPLPDGSTALEHTSSDYGVDEWLYSTSLNPCDVVRFYQQHDSECHVAAGSCGSEGNLTSQWLESNQITQCAGKMRFSIFAMRWDVTVSAGLNDDGLTHFRLSREVFWTGGIPPKQQP